MSDPNRATLITVGAPKSAKANVIKTVRLTINLDESNESKYPELNYKELVFAEESQRSVPNGKTSGLDPFSDNDDDVERVARKFEQKYGGKSTYGRKKARSKQDDFADIGAGYDENDSFIDNTHGYDEMIPPECDTLYGGFYINSGSLEFKTVPHDASANPDEPANRRNKRRISSSSSEDDSSDSSSESESGDGEEKDTKAVANGDHHSHKTEHRKKKNKKIDEKKAKKIRRTDSSAATSGKQTSDENNHGDAESADCADSRTSQSDSLASKPAPSSENAVTSDSSRDIESKAESKLPPPVSAALDTLEALLARSLLDTNAPATVSSQLLANSEPYLLRLEQALKSSSCDAATSRAAWSRAAASLGISRNKLMQRLKLMADTKPEPPPDKEPSTALRINAPQPAATTTTTVTTATTTVPTNNKRKHDDIDNIDVSKLTDVQRDDKIVETLQRLKALIDERKPSMLANYNAECERVQEERKKLQIAQAADGAPHVEKRLPKRRFPWCPKSRTLLSRLTRLAVDQQEAALLLAKRALPLFPNGFVRMPTLLRQADLSKEIKISEVKRQRLGSASQVTIPNLQPPPRTTVTTPPPLQFAEPIQFPSSLTVTTSTKTTSEKMDTDENDKFKSNSVFGLIKNTFSLSKDLIVEKDDKRDDPYVPPNNIGCITITPVSNISKEKKTSVIEKQQNTAGLIRVKSPAALNDMVNKKDLKVIKKIEKSISNTKDKRVDSPLHIDISYQPSKKDPSPKDGNYTLSKKDPSPKESSYHCKKDPSPKESSYQIKKDSSSKETNYQSKTDASPKESSYQIKKDPSPKESNFQSKKDPSPKESSYQIKKDSSSKETSYQSKKDPSPKESSYQIKKDPSPKESNYQIKKDSSPKESNSQSKKDSSSRESGYSSSKKDPSPKGKDEVTTKQSESARNAENNLPRPTLIPVHHSPTFAKPDKRPPELKKKKDLIVVSDLDPLSDISEPVNIDDSSSDVEVIEVDKSDSVVPSKDKSSVKSVPKVREGNEDAVDSEIDKLMRNLREMEHSQEPTKFNSQSYGGVITSAQNELL